MTFNEYYEEEMKKKYLSEPSAIRTDKYLMINVSENGFEDIWQKIRMIDPMEYTTYKENKNE